MNFLVLTGSFSKSQSQTEYDIVYILGGEKLCYGIKEKSIFPHSWYIQKSKPHWVLNKEKKHGYAPSFIPKIYWVDQKVHSGFSIPSYRKTQTNILANPL